MTGCPLAYDRVELQRGPNLGCNVIQRRAWRFREIARTKGKPKPVPLVAREDMEMDVENSLARPKCSLYCPPVRVIMVNAKG